MLRAAWDGYERAWVVGAEERSDVATLLAGEQVHYAYSPAARSVKNLLRNLALAGRLLRRLRPRVVLTTGAAVAVPFAWMARLRRIPVAYVESLARAERPSLSCRLVAPSPTASTFNGPSPEPPYRVRAMRAPWSGAAGPTAGGDVRASGVDRWSRVPGR